MWAWLKARWCFYFHWRQQWGDYFLCHTCGRKSLPRVMSEDELLAALRADLNRK